MIGLITPHEAARIAELVQANTYYGYARVTLRFSDARATPRGVEILLQALNTTREQGMEVEVLLDGPCSARLHALSPQPGVKPLTRTRRAIGFHAQEPR